MSDKAQHQQWCTKAKEVLEQSPVEAPSFMMPTANTKSKWHTPALFSVLVSIGLVGAASWGVLQAQEAPSGVAMTKANKATKVNVPSVRQDETFKMSYELNVTEKNQKM